MTRCGTVLLLALSLPATAVSARDPYALTQSEDYYRQTIVQLTAQQMRDPSSAVYEFRGDFYKVSCRRFFSRPQPGFKRWVGWAFDFGVNGKNGYGGYTGMQWYRVVIDGDQVFAFDYGKGTADYMCKRDG